MRTWGRSFYGLQAQLPVVALPLLNKVSVSKSRKSACTVARLSGSSFSWTESDPPENSLNLRRSRLVVHLLLGLALLVAQAGAQAHAYSHLQGSATKSDLGAAGQLCRECLSFAPVALPGGSPQAVEFTIVVGAVECPAPLYPLPVQQTYVAHYRSRAPPTLL